MRPVEGSDLMTVESTPVVTRKRPSCGGAIGSVGGSGDEGTTIGSGRGGVPSILDVRGTKTPFCGAAACEVLIINARAIARKVAVENMFNRLR